VIRRVALLAFLAAASSSVIAAGLYQGTPQEQAACRPDVRKFCHAVPAGASSGDFLACLQANRAKLSAACNAVLKSHGQ
jgi:hypothetical protein